jgi:hypothetical protein
MLGLNNSLTQDYKTVFTDKYSLEFDGANDYVVIDFIIPDINVEEGTISAWVKVATTSTSGSIVQFRTDTDNIMNLFYHNGSAEGRFTYKAGGSAKVASFTDTMENSGDWHHMVATWSVSEDEIQLFLGGTLKDTTSSLGDWEGTVDAAHIGQNTAGSAFFKGKIDDVAIFNKPLSDAEIVTVYNSGKPNNNFPVGLIGHYQFEEGKGAVAGDASGLGNTGTLTNMTDSDYVTDVP